ncbi:MAG: metallophosphoesterase family protein [Ignavibacteriae bacterium]|nr:metallophosphoesterase family protein [Ignavibacteria bacterium]MBI3364230.1 metallophosphoesterase family protein [Ignavibacteriota bacterium]
MRIAIISDIHGNLEALETALHVIREEQADKIVCLGDIVGYGASPNECIDVIQSTTNHVLLGNHDEAAIHLEKTEYFNPYARIAAEWTHGALTAEKKIFIGQLPFTFDLDGIFFVHASPYEPEEWHYVLSPADAQFNFSYFQEPLCFVGHSHVPGVFCEDIWTREVEHGKKFIVNVGSIGQPRDNDWRLSFGIFDTDGWTYRNIRCEYDVKKAADKIRRAGLPKALAERLLVGR